MSVGVEVLPNGGGYRVSCPQHLLDRVVETPQHAANLEALHLRVDHADDTEPISVDLTAAAQVIVNQMTHGTGWGERGVGRPGHDVWCALLGTDAMTGTALAREIAAADPPITATVPPF